ncbi:hypothetical protein OTU49_011261 [Cherax quadricarinatus]|uniref:HTH CENPB-type domain-containing protein n=1 Tax=Cherax quadricarinatus TaxID=27406 RepID=A0AAW0W5S1_CHEQU
MSDPALPVYGSDLHYSTNINCVSSSTSTRNTSATSYINSENATDGQVGPLVYPNSGHNASYLNMGSGCDEAANGRIKAGLNVRKKMPDKKKSGCVGVLIKEEREHRPTNLSGPPTHDIPVIKRRRTVLSIAEKAELIRRLHNGDSQRQLALEYGIGTSTVSDVKKHEAEILKYVETNGDFVAMTRRKLESGAKADVEEAVFDWLVQEMRGGKMMTGTAVMAKARQEHFRLRGNEEFRASTGWLERFKRRYNIRFFKPDEVDLWRPIISRVSQEDVLKAGRGRRRRRPPTARQGGNLKLGKRIRKGSTLAFIEHVLEGSSPPSVKSEVENPDDYEYTEEQLDGDLSPGSHSTIQPLVSLEEGKIALDIPPVQEIPSAGETVSLLSKALVWAAAQPDTTPQELFVMKQLQTRAAARSMMHNSH